MITKKNKPAKPSTEFDPGESIKRARTTKANGHRWQLSVAQGNYSWSTRMERVALVREGIPYEAIEVLSERTNLPVKQVLGSLGVPQTTYNKKKRDKDLLSPRDSEAVLVLTELLDFGMQVFNNEKKKFQHWLRLPNISLGGVAPESLFDSLTGMQEVRNCLNRLEYGNFA